AVGAVQRANWSNADRGAVVPRRRAGDAVVAVHVRIKTAEIFEFGRTRRELVGIVVRGDAVRYRARPVSRRIKSLNILRHRVQHGWRNDVIREWLASYNAGGGIDGL